MPESLRINNKQKIYYNTTAMPRAIKQKSTSTIVLRKIEQKKITGATVEQARHDNKLKEILTRNF